MVIWMISKKVLLLLGGLVVIGSALHQPKVTTEMKDDTGMLIQELGESELKEYELKIVNLLNEKNWINTASVSLNYVNEANKTICATVIVDSAELEDNKDEIVSIVTDSIVKSDLDIEDLLIFDAHGNEIDY